MYVKIDIVIKTLDGNLLTVIDTKYKLGDNPNNNDIYQVIAYATALNCKNSLLVYPTTLNTPLACPVGSISCASMSVPMDLSPPIAIDLLVKDIENRFTCNSPQKMENYNRNDLINGGPSVTRTRDLTLIRGAL